MMPSFLLLWSLLFVSVQVQAQSIARTVTYLHTLPAEGVLLDKGWKYSAGDNPAWAKPQFDDAQWQPVDPTLDIQESLPQIPRSGIGWFRLHLSLDSTVREQQLALMVQQSGASEIYLNGRLIHQFGVISTNPREVKIHDPMWKPVPFPITEGRHQVLAVRYALQPKASYTTMFETSNPALWIKIKNLDTAIDDHERYYTRMLAFLAFIIGACAVLVFLHTSFYVFRPQQKANISFAFFAFFFLSENVLRMWGFLNGNDVASRFLLYNVCFTFILLADMFLLTAVYQLSDRKKDTIYFTLLVLVVLSVVFIIPQYGWGWIVGGALLEVAIKLNILLVALQSAKKGKRGAWFIAWGAISCLLFFVFFLSMGVFSREFFLGLSPFRSVLYIISVLSIPIATSIYLGLDFAFINSTLNRKLAEVEELSQKAIIQEKEKQELLASQNVTLEKQVEERTYELSLSLKELKATQAQLIQKEKMASLGELTAGVAHEIQNPLNFVTNFSEVSVELCSEIEDEAKAGAPEMVLSITADLKQNLQKIHHHGKRADAIVKNMLQHSRTSAGEKQLTNLSALAEEYLRLSYSGIRAKEKNFQCTIDTSYDHSLGDVEVVPQELGRVLLNLFNNAFYAVQQKQKLGLVGYEPKVAVSTATRNGKVELRVWDNGTGIPESVKDKIFQPFFTTKPTGQGTGLGLSLSYDIITKGHGGELSVATVQGEWTEFTITLLYVPVADESTLQPAPY